MAGELDKGRLSTHILDTASGVPGAGIRISLFRHGPEKEFISEAVSNSDGRTDSPLLEGQNLSKGTYELQFHVGDYFKASKSPTIYDDISIRFIIDNENGHYHIPLLVSPFGYSTYRGS